jgi:hypothetical protein
MSALLIFYLGLNLDLIILEPVPKNMAFETKNGSSNSDTVKLPFGHSGERGFSGTLLESSKVGNFETREVLNDDLHEHDQTFSEEI